MKKSRLGIFILGISSGAILMLAITPFLMPYLIFAPEVIKEIGLSIFQTSRTVHEGEAYGFRIGATKQQAFSAARTLLTKGKFFGLAPWVDRDTYCKIYPGIFDYRPPGEFADAIDGWDFWKIRGFTDGVTEELLLIFGYGNRLLNIHRTRSNTAGWPDDYPEKWPADPELPEIREGMSPREALEALAGLQAYPEYERIEMAPSRWRSISDPTPDEFERIRPFDEWHLRKADTPFTDDSIHLRFTDNRLTEIGRYRSYDPFPL